MRNTKKIFIILVNLTAILILVIGLISPLTPSEGTPSSIELFIFAICPILTLCLLAWFVQNKRVKIIVVVEIVIITALLIKVLGLVYRTSRI
jgi:hypothetical protein